MVTQEDDVERAGEAVERIGRNLAAIRGSRRFAKAPGPVASMTDSVVGFEYLERLLDHDRLQGEGPEFRRIPTGHVGAQQVAAHAAACLTQSLQTQAEVEGF